MNKKNPLVSICCITFNHEKYIRDAIEGFLVQKTNFSFEIIIHDDASTDDTANIIRGYEKKYPELFVCIYQKENQWSKGIRPSPTYVWPKARGKYIALCEGDDYWTDPYKLQKQVDFLEANPEYGLIHTNGVAYVERNGKEKIAYDEKIKSYLNDENNFCRNLLLGNVNVLTFSALFKKNILDEIGFINDNWNDYLMGDTKLWLDLAMISKVKFIDDFTGVYRIWGESVSRSKSFEKSWDFINSSYKLRLDYADRLKLSQSDKNKIHISFNRILLSIAASHNRPMLVKDTFKILKSYGEVNLKDKVIYLAYSNKLLYHLLRIYLAIMRVSKI